MTVDSRDDYDVYHTYEAGAMTSWLSFTDVWKDREKFDQLYIK